MTVAPVFDALADTYDAIFTESLIGRAQRQIVLHELERVLVPGQRVLEINCGTGVDATFMAERGVTVDACDASPRMIAVAERRRQATAPLLPVNFFVHTIERLDELERSYDGAVSNFGGLNCVCHIGTAAAHLARLVRPAGFLMICLAARLCAWELLWYAAHGEVKKAFRRLFGQGEFRLCDASMLVYYPTAGELARTFAPWFRVVRRLGVGVLVPPTYAEAWVRHHPRLFAGAVALDRYFSRLPLTRAVADHILLVLKRTKA